MKVGYVETPSGSKGISPNSIQRSKSINYRNQ